MIFFLALGLFVGLVGWIDAGLPWPSPRTRRQ
jgi:hypothetical protein